jgi:hypothetical protein
MVDFLAAAISDGALIGIGDNETSHTERPKFVAVNNSHPAVLFPVLI